MDFRAVKKSPASARTALIVSLVGPISFLLILLALIFLHPTPGFDAIVVFFWALALFTLISFSFGVTALILGEKAWRFAKKQGGSTTTASAAKIIACLDVVPMILFLITLFHSPFF